MADYQVTNLVHVTLFLVAVYKSRTPLVVDTLQTPEYRPLRLTLAIQCRIATSLHNCAACKLL